MLGGARDESMRGQPGFFDVDERLQRLTDLGDQLLAFAKVVEFEAFRPELTKTLAYSAAAQGGRPSLRNTSRGGRRGR
jgi:transposase, IS5 family